MNWASKGWMLAGLAWAALLVSATPIQAQEIKVRGVVVAESGKPIPGVKVQAFRQGEAGAEATSNTNGEYEVGLSPGRPIARIEYRHSSFDLASIVFVSGTDAQQRIVKVMYQVGSSRSAGAIADTVSAYEQFGVHAFVAPSAERTRLAAFSKQQEFTSRLSKMPIKVEDDFLANYLEMRRKAVMEMLGKL